MKILFTSLLMGIALNARAQIHEISSFSTGDIEFSSSILDKNSNVIGYTLIYNKGLEGENINYEYVILDKNLYKQSNGELKLPYDKKIKYAYTQSKFIDNKFVFNFRVFNNSKYKYVGYINTVIDGKTKEINSSKYISNFESGAIPNPKELTKKKPAFDSYTYEKMYTSHAQSTFYTTYAKGLDFDYFSIKTSDFGIFDENMNLIFKRNLEKSGLTGERFFEVTDFKDQQMVATSQYIKLKGLKAVTEVDSIYVRNLANDKWDAKINHNTDIEKGLPLHVDAKFVHDKLAVVTPLHTAALGVKGIRRSIYDDKGILQFDKYVLFQDILKSLNFGAKKFDDGYKLEVKEIINFNDYSYLVLLEKNKIPKVQIGVIGKKTEDYLLLYFDDKGEFVKHFQMNKSANKNSYDSYLFAQRDLDNKEVIFYYEDLDENFIKVKKRDLVVTKFSNNEFSEQRLPFKADKADFRFGNAKFGHILITEFSDNSEAVSLRLERINL